MIVVMGPRHTPADRAAVVREIEGAGLRVHISQGVERTVIGVVGDSHSKELLHESLEAMLGVVDAGHTLLLTGTGDVIQPTDSVLGIGSGGSYAVAAARALIAHSSLGAADIVRAALEIAAGIDVYTNTNIIVEELACQS